jgi:hypothetical protein
MYLNLNIKPAISGKLVHLILHNTQLHNENCANMNCGQNSWFKFQVSLIKPAVS